MRLLFIRVDEKRFHIEAGKSSGFSEKRELEILGRVLENHDPLHPIRDVKMTDWWIISNARREFSKKIIWFVKRHPEYTFWEAFDFYGGEFSYTAKKELFFEEKRKGATLADAIQAMKNT